MSRTGDRRLVAGMVGGGAGADIGKTHRFAMRLDDRFVLAAGVFGRDAHSSRATGAALGVDPDRVYDDHAQMAAAESAREDGCDVVVIATPNDSHFEIAKTFLEAGISIVCEKPVTSTVAEAAELARLADEKNLVYAVPHVYSAYAMVRHAAWLVRSGALGAIRLVVAEHASGWNAAPLERIGHKQAGWRTDPEMAGRASVVGDLGTHAYHLTRYVTGLDGEHVSARMDTLVPGRRVFDNANITARLTGDVPATIWASMAATGHVHGLRIRVFSENASLEWAHEDPHRLIVRGLDGEARTLTEGMATLSADATRLTRVGLGHAEGFIEAFGNFYRDVADVVIARRDGAAAPEATQAPQARFPDGDDGLRGVEFVEAVTQSHDGGGRWVELPTWPRPRSSDTSNTEEA